MQVTSKSSKKSDRTNYHQMFKNLYYHLYSNSNASRAESIVGDLTKILFAKIAHDRKLINLEEYHLSKNNDANQILLPKLKKIYKNKLNGWSEFSIGNEAIKNSFNILSNLDLKNTESHAIGEAFQALIGPKLRGDKGQFFTPHAIVKAMVQIVNPNNNSKIIDPACGTGGFLSESLNFVRSKYQKIDSSFELIGIDKDKDLASLAATTLEMLEKGNHNVINSDSLDIDSLKRGFKNLAFDADIVLTNPPFGARIGIKDKKILLQYNLGYKWFLSKADNKWVKSNQVRSSQDPQTLFLELCIVMLKPKGLLGIVLPEGVFGNKNSGYIWDYIRSKGRVVALIDAPRTTFQPGTDTKTNILFFEKGDLTKSLDKDQNVVSVAVALDCGHDRRGLTTKGNGEPFPNDFPKIANEYSNRKNSNYWSECAISNKYYWVPRYYDGVISKKMQGISKHLNADLVTLEELINNKGLVIRKGHEVGAEAYGTGEIPFIRTSDISNWEVSDDPTKSVSEEVYSQYSNKQKLQKEDILIVVDGRYRIGKTAILHEHNIQSVIQSHLRIITVTPKAPITSYELLYILNLPVVLEQIRGLIFIQSTLGSIGKRLLELQLPIPKKKKRWYKEVDQFRNLLESRATGLQLLQKFAIPETEL